MNFNVRLENDEYEATLLEMTDEVALVDVDGEVFEVRLDPESVKLFNPFHDSLGRFASKHGSQVGNAAVKDAAVGAVIGGVVGAVKGVFSKDEMGRKVGLRRGAFQGAVYGAKKGLITGAVRETFNVGASYAGNYGFAVKLLGGLSVAFAGAKGLSALGVTNTDIRGIGAGVAGAGLFDLVMQFEGVEGNMEKIKDVAMFLAEALEQHPEADYIGVEDIDMTPLGFEEKDGVYVIEQERAIALLAVLVEMGSTKLEIEQNEIIQLFNPYHDRLGRFASRAQGAGAIASNLGFVTMIGGGLATGITNIVVRNKAIKRAKEKQGNNRTPSFAKIESATEEILKEKIISTKIGGKSIDITYGQVKRGTEAVASVGVKSFVAGTILSFAMPVIAIGVGGDFKEGFVSEGDARYAAWKARQKAKGGRTEDDDFADWVKQNFNKHQSDYQKRAEEARQRAEKEWAEREARGKKSAKDYWPKTKQDEFKGMYRKLSKKYHPDVNPGNEDAAARMRQINDLYDAGAFDMLKNLYNQLEELLSVILLADESATIKSEILETIGTLVGILKEALKDKSDYIVFPHEGEEVEDMIYEDGEMIIDRITAQYIVDVVEAFIDTQKVELEDFSNIIA